MKNGDQKKKKKTAWRYVNVPANIIPVMEKNLQ